MKDALRKALVPATPGNGAEDKSTDRILAQSFFRTRPLHAVATVIRLEDRRPPPR